MNDLAAVKKFTMQDRDLVDVGIEANHQGEEACDAVADTKGCDKSVGQARARFDRWARFTNCFKRPLQNGLARVATISASYPYITIAVSIFVSLLLIVVGFLTNFRIESEGTILWTPSDCNSKIHGDWIASEASGFPQPARTMQVIVHAQGDNVLGYDGASKLFDVIETVRSTPGYEDVCRLGRDNLDGECPILSPTGFWLGHNRTIFNEQVQSNEDAIFQMSHIKFANQQPVDRTTIFGRVVPLVRHNASILDFNVSSILLESATAYLVSISLPPNDKEVRPWEADATEKLFALRGEWQQISGNKWVLELNTYRSFDDELNRGIQEDIPLMASAFVMMGLFCAMTLAKWHRVKSQSLLGVGAVATIVLALMTGYGLMFCIGVPFSSLTQVFPYVLVGIGLDATFIICGSYSRTDPHESVVDRVDLVMHEVGISVLVATLTTFSAFTLGGMSSLPGIRWFAWYAGPTVLIDFVYQVTFFIALLSIDDKRQKANRRDCCPCCRVGSSTIDEQADQTVEVISGGVARSSFFTSIVQSYSDFLLRPLTKVSVLVLFALLLILGSVAASKQSQEFDFLSLTPPDSFVRDFFFALDDFVGTQISQFASACYFRDIDVSERANQFAMAKFVDDMVALEYISYPPTSFWLRDFLRFANQTENVTDLPFFEQLDIFLSTAPYDILYGGDVIRDEKSMFVTASRVFVVYDEVSATDNEQQIEVLHAQTQVAASQQLNSGQRAQMWPIFSFGEIYYAWELYAVIVKEILTSVVLGLIAVFVIALLFVPHPVGALLVTPVVAAIYVELMGVLQVAGIYINSVSAVGLTMSIGLVVDYNMHVVLTYFETEDVETREQRVKNVIRTMGKSIMLGGFSTFLGVLPLSFSGSEVFRTFFVTFLGIVFLGVGHGLIFMPVVLSMVAPHIPPVYCEQIGEMSVEPAAEIQDRNAMEKNETNDTDPTAPDKSS